MWTPSPQAFQAQTGKAPDISGQIINWRMKTTAEHMSGVGTRAAGLRALQPREVEADRLQGEELQEQREGWPTGAAPHWQEVGLGRVLPSREKRGQSWRWCLLARPS